MTEKAYNGIKDSRKLYVTICKENNIKALQREIYYELCSEFMLFLSNKILEGFKIYLPEKMGRLLIKGFKRKRILGKDGEVMLAPDWKKTKALWERNEKAKEDKKLVYLDNEHSNSYVYRIYWDKYKVMLKHISIYKYVPAFHFKRKTAQEIKNGTEYHLKN